MKLIFYFLTIICLNQALNTVCIGELAKLGIDVAKLSADMSVGAIIKMAKDATKTYVEFRKVVSVCGSSVQNILDHFDITETLYQIQSVSSSSCEVDAQELIKKIEIDLEGSQTIKEFRNSINIHYASALKLGSNCALSLIPDQSFIKNALTKSIPQIKLCFESFNKLKSHNKSLKDILIYGIQFAYNCDLVDQESIQQIQKILEYITLPQLKDCVNKGQSFSHQAQVILKKIYNQVDYLDKEFIDQTVKVAESIEPLLNSCQLNTLDEKWNTLLPQKCIEILGSLAHDKRKLRDDIDKPFIHKKDEIKYKFDLALALKECSFIVNHVIKH